MATLLANVLGCFFIGLLVQWSYQAEITTKWYVVGLRVGFLGGLTTFSAFALDLIRLWYEQRTLGTLALAASHLAFGLSAVVAGMACISPNSNSAGEA
jgi:CrcB protein